MPNTTRDGVLFAISAYSFWAIAPIYFKWVSAVSPAEVLSHRVIWSFILTIGIILATRRLTALLIALKSRKTRLYLLATTLLIGVNWSVFIWAINSNQMLSASLGYYINPLIYIMLGMFFFAEKLDVVKKIAAGLCIVAVGFEVIQFGEFPTIALGLAVTFGLYGLVRKKLGVDSLVGMALETGLMMPLAIAYVVFADSPTTNLFQNSASLNLLLFMAGPVTMIPLLCFAAAANRISLTALGFFQYIGPSGMFILAVFVYGEPLSTEKLTTFVIIWFALVLLVWDTVRRHKRNKRDKIKALNVPL